MMEKLDRRQTMKDVEPERARALIELTAQLASVSGGEEPSFIIGMRSSELRELEDIGWEENDLRELDGEVVIDAPFHRVKSSVNQS
jgi:hypothetical protein